MGIVLANKNAQFNAGFSGTYNLVRKQYMKCIFKMTTGYNLSYNSVSLLNIVVAKPWDMQACVYLQDDEGYKENHT